MSISRRETSLIRILPEALSPQTTQISTLVQLGGRQPCGECDRGGDGRIVSGDAGGGDQPVSLPLDKFNTPDSSSSLKAGFIETSGFNSKPEDLLSPFAAQSAAVGRTDRLMCVLGRLLRRARSLEVGGRMLIEISGRCSLFKFSCQFLKIEKYCNKKKWSKAIFIIVKNEIRMYIKDILNHDVMKCLKSFIALAHNKSMRHKQDESLTF